MGKSRTVINPELASQLGLERTRDGVRIGNLRLGTRNYNVPSAKLVDQTGIDDEMPEQILAGVGSDILSRFVWAVDYGAGLLWIPVPQ